MRGGVGRRKGIVRGEKMEDIWEEEGDQQTGRGTGKDSWGGSGGRKGGEGRDRGRQRWGKVEVREGRGGGSGEKVEVEAVG